VRSVKVIDLTSALRRGLWLTMWIVLGLVLLGAESCPAQDYIVGEGDVLKITVYDNPDLSTTVRVDGEGNILMPLLGQVNVAGRPVAAVAGLLVSRLAEGYLVDPQVNVFIEEFKSKKAVILGQVIKPGQYELRGSTTLLEVISLAGGLAVDAGNTVTIKRRHDGADATTSDIITIDMNKLVEQGDTALNVQIMDGDTINISRTGMYFVTGEVNKPGSYKYDEKTTVIKAITMAGGFTDTASIGRLRIIRKVEDKETVLENVKMEAAVQPEDVIVVPESFF